MTILEFARLCGTSSQTLRYYDRIELLKPSHVDNWTGYRYYEKEQAADFVKIKNLQLADFSISEIKALLTASPEEITRAFDAKIAAEQEKLAKILKIQELYRKETMNIEEKISAISAFIHGDLPGEALKQRFPELEPEEIMQWKDNVKGFRPEDYEPVSAWRGFRSFQDVVNEIPPLNGEDYALIAGTVKEEDKNALVMMLMNAALEKSVPTEGRHPNYSVILVDDPQGENSLKLMRKRA